MATKSVEARRASTNSKRFQTGNPGGGRPKGAKDKVPGARKLRASIRRYIARLVGKNPASVKRALRRGLFSYDPKVAFPYVQLATHMLDGKPVESIKMHLDKPQGNDRHDWSKLEPKEQVVLLGLLAKAKVDEPPESIEDDE